MSDEVARAFEAKVPQELPGAPPQKSVTLSVTLQPDGEIQFQLPVGNKILAYGLLEVARAQLDKLYLVNELKQATPPRGGVDGFLRRMNGGK